MVAGLGDELAGFVEVLPGGGGVGLGEGEAGAFEVEVGEVQAHLAAAGDLFDLVQVAAGSVEVALAAVNLGPGEQAADHEFLSTGGAEAVDGLLEALGGLGEVAQGQCGLGPGSSGPGELTVGQRLRFPAQSSVCVARRCASAGWPWASTRSQNR